MSKKTDKDQWLKQLQNDGEDNPFSAKRIKFEADSKNLEMAALMPVARDRCSELFESKDGKTEERKSGSAQIEVLSAEQAQSLLGEGLQVNDLEKMALAMKSGARLDVIGAYGMDPFMEAVDRGNRDAVRLLVKLGANVNAINNDGSSPLTLAIMNSDKGVVSDLIALGANVNSVSKSDETPLMEALYCHAPHSIVQLLLDKGANPFYRCKETKDTPMKLAQADNREEIRAMFKLYEFLVSDGREFAKRGVVQGTAFQDPRKLFN